MIPRVRRGRAAPSFSGFDRRLLAPMILGAILNPINSSMIAVALVPIGIAFGAPPTQTAWLVSGLYLATATGQPVVGRMVDMFGPRRLFLGGTALVGIAGVIGALAPSLGVLVGARVLLGFGTCAGYPAAMYLIRSESTRTGQDSPTGVLTALAVSTQTIAVIGPSLGGLLIGLGGWRTIFAVNVPLAIAGVVLGWLRLPTVERRASTGGFDFPGMALFAAALTALLLFLMHPSRWYLVVLAIAAGAGFAVRELRAAEPFVDIRVLGGNAPLIATYARNVLTFIVSYSFLYGYTQWLEAGRGLSPSGAGLLLLPMFGVAIVVASITGRRREVRGKLVVGGLGQVVACALLLVVGADTPIWFLLGIAIIVGIPQGLNSLANQNALYFQADPDRMGSSAGLLRTCTYLGAIVSAAANGAFFGGGVDTAGLHEMAWFLVGVAVVFIALTLSDRSLRRVGVPASEAELNLANQ